ncbi:MAG: energy transducer TonB [Proteobacteria bacterium]|nr:energy transducer TonB [Pseudomonadota bacterium]
MNPRLVAAAVTVALTLSLAPPAPAQEQLAVYRLEAAGRIEIAPDGSVHDLQLEAGHKATVAQALTKSIRGWRFEPITQDGKPVIASTRLRLELEARPATDGDYRLFIDKVHFGEPGQNHQLNPPRYPRDAVRAGVSGRVVLVLKLDGAGNVERVHVEQTSLDPHASSRYAKRWRERFEQASVASARNWKFDMTETIAGEPVGASVRVPVDYAFRRGHGKAWQAYVPGPYRPVPWVSADTVAATQADELGNGEVQALDSRFELKSDVVGHAL